MPELLLSVAALFLAPAGWTEAVPLCAASRVEAIDVRGPMRTRYGWGHEIVFEIEIEGDPEHCELEWWEYVSYEGSEWSSPAVYAHPSVREGLWQDHRRINARSSTWAPWERRGSGAVVRLVDRPSIPLGNVRLADGRWYANLARKLLIEVRVVGRDATGRKQARSAFLFQSLREREGVPDGGLISSGPSNFKSVVASRAPSP